MTGSGAPPFDVHGGPSGKLEDDAKVKIDFSVSLNAFGPAPCVVDAIRNAPVDVYPDPTSLQVRHVAAKRWGCSAWEIAFGAGASELIYAIARAFVKPDDRVVVVTPTFGEYQRAAQMMGAVAHTISWNVERATVDVDAIATMIGTLRPTVTFVCAPNNPTGSVMPREHLAYLADACALIGGLFVIDQSYDAFASHPMGTPVLRNYPSVLHLRSITKDHALAGVRAGFVLGPSPTIRALELMRPPWSASTIAQAAAIAALSDAGDAHLSRTIPVLRAERARIDAACLANGFRTIAGDTHTLLIDVGSAHIVQATVLEHYGIRTRDCTSFGLPRFIRIAARTPAENDRLIEALSEIHALSTLTARNGSQ